MFADFLQYFKFKIITQLRNIHVQYFLLFEKFLSFLKQNYNNFKIESKLIILRNEIY